MNPSSKECQPRVSTARPHLCRPPHPGPPAVLTLLPDPGRGSFVQTRIEVLAGDLQFSKLSLEDSGMYQCVAENKHGTIYASAELAVQGKGPREAQVGLSELTRSISKHTHTLAVF